MNLTIPWLKKGMCSLSERVTYTPLVPSRTLFGSYTPTLRHRPPISLGRFPMCVQTGVVSLKVLLLAPHLGPSMLLILCLGYIRVRFRNDPLGTLVFPIRKPRFPKHGTRSVRPLSV